MVKKNSGYLVLVVAILLVVIAGFAASFVGQMGSTVNAETSVVTSNAAFNLAQTGIEHGNYQLSLANCDTSWNMVTTGAGQYQYSCTPYSASTTLSGTINATTKAITLNSTAGFATFGALTIDSETIYYDGISGNSLQNVQRKQNGSTAASHTNGAASAQTEFIISSKAGVPSLSAPFGSATLSNAVLLDVNSIYYPVGDNGSRAVILSFNGSTWSTAVNGPSGISMQSVDMNTTYGGAVGIGGLILVSSYLATFNGTSWTAINNFAGLRSYSSVSCDPTLPTNCWAGGSLLNIISIIKPLGLLYHSGLEFPALLNFSANSISCNSGWCLASGSILGLPNLLYYFPINTNAPYNNTVITLGVNITDVHCPALNSCAVVTSNGYAYNFNGSTVQGPYVLSASSLNSVHCPAAGNCKIVGNSGTIFNCSFPFTSASSCTPQAAPGSLNLQAVHCNSVSDCLAVGLNSSIAYRYVAGNWITTSMPAAYNLYDVGGIPGTTGVITPTIWHNQ